MNLVKELKNKDILKFGDFTLRSGIKSHYYCDIKEALGDPKLLNLMASELAKVVPKSATCIAGSGYGGVTLSSLVANKLKLPLVLTRDKVKDHGMKKVIDGYVPKYRDFVCIVDDVFSTGSSVRETKKKLAVTKAKFTKAVVVLNRSKKNEVISLMKDEDIKEV